MKYSLTMCFILSQLIKIHIGVNNAVNIKKFSAIPSTPIVKVPPANGNQLILVRN